ncbi:MAG: ribosome hibernation-promoting factor, HPF/YfiA family [Anaeroplasmataceae bacterium]
MKVEVVGKNGFNPSDANRDYAEKKLSKLQNYFQEELNARVVCKVYPKFHKVEVTIPTKNAILRAEVADEDLYAAIDKTIEKLISQIRKYKTRVKEKSDKEGIKDIFYDANLDLEALDKEMKAAQLVRNKQVELKPMTLEEAMGQMELTGHDFFVYLDKESGRINVLYLREDGDYAVIETRQ